MGGTDDGAGVGDALLVAGHDTASVGVDDPRLPLVTQLGEALLASASPWRVRRLAAGGSERDVASRGTVRRELDALLQRPATARILVIAAELTRTVEGLAVVCAPALGGFREDVTVPLEWLALRLRLAADVPTAIVVAIPGVARDASACLDVLGTAASEHLIMVHAGEPVAALRGLIDGLRGEAVDLATGTVTPCSLGDHLGRRLGHPAIQPSSSMRTLVAPRSLARTQRAERPGGRADDRAHQAAGRADDSADDSADDQANARADDRADDLIGAVLPGRFRVVSKLGRGSFGVVYRAHQELVDRPVAIKVLPARLGVEAIRRFALEIRAVGRLDHRNVVRVLHADAMRDGRMFVAMELLSGPTLEQLLSGGPLPATRALALARQLLAGLAAAHAAGILHADVKPANAIVVDGSDPRLVLLDFGFSRLRADDTAATHGGTPAFMAPEQLGGGRVDASVDLYAAALVSLTLVAGAVPRTPAERARALAAFVDDRVRAALERALADDPAKRFASAVEMAAALGDEPLGERIDYRIERQRHDGFVGRAALLDRLDQLLVADHIDRWVVVTGGPGMGKSAVLAAWLARREAAGAVVPHHFIRRGEYDWDDPARLVGSLVAQIEAQLPDQREPAADAQHRPAARLAATLSRISANVLVPRGERLVVLVDGLDEYDPPAGAPTGDPLAAFLPHALPGGVSFLCASRPRHPHVSVLEARDGDLVRIDLDDPELATDNDATVRCLWERAAPALGLDAHFIEEAVARASGNLQHAVTLRKHVAGLPAAQRRVEAIPRGLAALLAKLWHRTSTDAIVVHGLGILCAAREALTLDELGVTAGWADAAQRQAFVRGASELLVETRRADDQTEYRLHHDTIRHHVASMVGPAALRAHHAALARQLATWPAPLDPTARRYALRHALAHRAEAGDWLEAWRLAADIGFLEAQVRELGAHAAEADVTRAAERCRTGGDQAIGRRFDDLARALVRESHWLRDAPAATAALVWNRLRRSGWSVQDLDERLQLPPGARFLRVRHTATRASAALVRNLVGHASAVHACAVTPDGRRVVSASEDYSVKVWDLDSGRAIASFEGHSYGVMACAVTPDGRRVVSASNDRTLKVWDLAGRRVLASLHGHTGAVNACSVAPDGRHLVSASDDRTLKLWDLDTGSALATFEGHARAVVACVVTPDGKRVVSASSDGALKLWDLHSGRVLATFEGHTLRVTACAVTPDGRRVVSASSDRTLKLWDLDTGRVLVTFEGHADSVTACAVTPDGRRVVSASGDQTLKVWDLASGCVLATFEGHTLWVTACAVTPDGAHLVSASSDRTVRVWDLAGDRSLPTFEGHTDAVTACVVTPDDRRAVSASDDRTLKVWDLASGSVLATFTGHTDCVTACAMAPDGSRVVSGSRDRTLRVWELDSGHVHTIFEGHTDGVTACAVTPDGRHVVSASKDRTLKVWELETARVVATFAGHADLVTACAVTPDGRRVVSASWDALKLWELDSGRQLASFTGRTDWVTTCAVTPEGRRVVSGSQYQALTLWDLDRHHILASFDSPARGSRACAVTLDGGRVISASPRHTLEVWDLDTHACVLTHRGDAPYTAVATSATTVVAGDDAGTVWFLEWPASI